MRSGLLTRRRRPDRRAPDDADRRALRRLPDSLAAAGSVPLHRHNVRTYLDRLARSDCGFKRLADLNREALERWLAAETEERAVGSVSQHCHRAALIAFANWCADPSIGRLSSNPFKGVPKADEKADPRRRRRSMTEAELVRLLDVARRRPLLDALTVRTGQEEGASRRERATRSQGTTRSGRPGASLDLQDAGSDRAAEERAGDLDCRSTPARRSVRYVELDAADEKNREGNDVIVRADLASDLRAWLADKLAALQAEALRQGEPIPARLPSDTLVFVVPTALDKIFNGDLKAAGIPKRDDRGRTLDVHALRTTFGTLLGRAGCHCERRKPRCGTATRSSPRMSTPTRSSWTLKGLSTPCRACRSTRGRPPSERRPGDRDRRFEPDAPLHRSLH